MANGPQPGRQMSVAPPDRAGGPLMRAVIRNGGLLAAVQAAIGAAPAAAGGTVIAVSVRSAPAARSAALRDFCNSSATLHGCHNHCGLGHAGEQQRCRGHSKAADAEIGHIRLLMFSINRPHSNRPSERIIRCLVPALTCCLRSPRSSAIIASWAHHGLITGSSWASIAARWKTSAAAPPRKTAAEQRATDPQIMADAERLVAVWNERQVKRMPMLFSPTIGAAIAAGFWFLWVRCPACWTINAIDLRTLDRHHNAAITGLIPALSCRSCRPNAPFAELIRLSRKSIADEMREEHRRRVLGDK